MRLFRVSSRIIFVYVAAMLLCCATAPLTAGPTVTNVVARQETDGSQKVVITYNVSDPDSSRVYVTVKASSNDGASFDITPRYLSGDVGWTRVGNAKKIVWNCGLDLPGAKGENYRVRITADANYSGGTPGEMVYIPAGSFLMGNNGNEPDSCLNELPQHCVYLSGYSIGKYQVTRGEYAQFIAAGGYSNSSYWSTEGWNWKATNNRTEPDYWDAVQDWGTGSFTQTDNHPVVGVSYYEAEAYCNWAGGRLPTEAEWEKAARWQAVTEHPRVYPWGDVWNPEKCNNWDDTNPAGGGYQKMQTAPVGSYPVGVSPYGLYDMAGNVWEWCKDWYASDYYSHAPPGGWIDPKGRTTGTYRVLRGDSWGYVTGLNCRSAYRYYETPFVSNVRSFGFRIAR